MEQKRVTFKVAKAIGKAGYWGKYHTRCLVKEIVDSKSLIVDFDCSLVFKEVPTYLDVWLWLWREKKVWIEALNLSGSFLAFIDKKPFGESVYKDPEDAIIAAIEYLVGNDLIK